MALALLLKMGLYVTTKVKLNVGIFNFWNLNNRKIKKSKNALGNCF